MLGGYPSYDPVKLEDGSITLEASQDVTTIAWRDTEFGGEPSDVPTKVKVDIAPRLRCTLLFLLGAKWICNNMICTHREGKHACLGDSGGPLLRKGDSPVDDVQGMFQRASCLCRDGRRNGFHPRVC